jgi:hypothetical protein
MHEECVWNIHGTEFLALPAVDTGVSDVGIPDQVEHEVRRHLARGDQVGLFGTAFDAVADRAVLNAGVALDAP